MGGGGVNMMSSTPAAEEAEPRRLPPLPHEFDDMPNHPPASCPTEAAAALKTTHSVLSSKGSTAAAAAAEMRLPQPPQAEMKCSCCPPQLPRQHQHFREPHQLSRFPGIPKSERKKAAEAATASNHHLHSSFTKSKANLVYFACGLM